MSLPSKESGQECWLVRVARALSDWTAGSRLDGLEGCPPDEVGRIAQDLNLSRGELISLAALGPHAADEVYRRLDVLDVDPEQLQRRAPALTRDLVRVCAFCTSKARCSTDLNWCPDAPDWTDYCPNAAILQSLRPGASASET